jgi:hypothetical protein
VRHKVVAVMVVRRHIGDTTRCPLSGLLRRWAGRSRPGQRLRTMDPPSRTGRETVRPRCLCQHPDGEGARRGGMAHTGARALHSVTDNQPKVLAGWSHKGPVAGTRLGVFLVMGPHRSRWKARASPPRLFRHRPMATPSGSQQGQHAVRRAPGGAGRSGGSQRRPPCHGVERGGATGTLPPATAGRRPAGLASPERWVHLGGRDGRGQRCHRLGHAPHAPRPGIPLSGIWGTGRGGGSRRGVCRPCRPGGGARDAPGPRGSPRR